MKEKRRAGFKDISERLDIRKVPWRLHAKHVRPEAFGV